MILFDTDVCIELLRGNEKVIFHRNAVPEEIAVSFMTVGELYCGARKSSKPAVNLHVVEKFLLSVTILDSNLEIMGKYGELRASLEMKGVRLQDADLLIASTALVECDRLVSGNRSHYDRIPDLRIENWIA